MNTPTPHITQNTKTQGVTKLYKVQKTKGFTLFLALIVASLLLAIGFSLSTIILKQLVFANSGKESQLAFYAADSGAECALYWDRKGVDGLTVFDGAFSTSSTYKDIFCGLGGPATPYSAQVGSFDKLVNPNNLEATTTFYVDYSDPSNVNHKACAKVTVYKVLDTSTGVPVDKTQIDSRGYNVPLVGTVGSDVLPANGAKCDFSNINRIVERAVRLDY